MSARSFLFFVVVFAVGSQMISASVADARGCCWANRRNCCVRPAATTCCDPCGSVPSCTPGDFLPNGAALPSGAPADPLADLTPSGGGTVHVSGLQNVPAQAPTVISEPAR